MYFRAAIDAGIRAEHDLARLLATQPGRDTEAESFFRQAINSNDIEAIKGLRALLAKQPGRKAEARQLQHLYHQRRQRKGFRLKLR
jgi:hypothetical protein